MFEAHGEVALVNIIRSHAHLDEFVDEVSHHEDAVVDAAEEDALVAERHTRISESLASGCRFRCHLIRMVEVGVDPYRVVFLKHLAQLRSDTLRADHRGTGADTHYLHMFYLAEAGDDIF